MYNLQLNTVHDVSSVIDKICEVNPLFKEKNPKPLLTVKKGRVLEPDRKLIFYDLKDNDVIHLQLAPIYWFYKPFRTDVNFKSEKDLKDEEEIREIVARKKMEKEQAAATAAASGEEEDEEESEEEK